MGDIEEYTYGKYKLEICVFDAESAFEAFACSENANRIELCADQSVGGVTPSMSTFHQVRGRSMDGNQISNSGMGENIINVMIRPRGGDFVYTEQELKGMVTDIKMLKDAGADGFVFGCLEVVDGKYLVDKKACKTLREAAGDTPCTFHKAFDEILKVDMIEQLEVMIELGFRSLLTSGGANSAVEGTDMLADLVNVAAGNIEIIVAGGVRSTNLKDLKNRTKAPWYHSSAIIITLQPQERLAIVPISRIYAGGPYNVIMVLRNVGNVLAIVILMVNVPKLEFSTREVVRMKTVLDWNDDN